MTRLNRAEQHYQRAVSQHIARRARRAVFGFHWSTEQSEQNIIDRFSRAGVPQSGAVKLGKICAGEGRRPSRRLATGVGGQVNPTT